MGPRAGARRRFTKAQLATIDATKYFRVRAGLEHKMLAVWVVVVEGRVFVRSWNDKPTGWYRAFLTQKVGAVLVGKAEIVVRAEPVRREKVLDAMDEAYAAKYDTKANAKYVKGLRTAKRRACSLELVPRPYSSSTGASQSPRSALRRRRL